MKKDISYLAIQALTKQLASKIEQSGNDFDCILGIARGGSIPATMLSYQLEIPEVRYIQLSSYTEQQRGNVWMDELDNNVIQHIKLSYAHVLLVDDLSDSGQSFSFLSTKLKQSGVLHKTAALYLKTASTFQPDFYSAEVPADLWLNFPWENCRN
tara:strand:+ start:859 stop:1323 length:465 start_codon:yes stop_codon:yes gene_type:complete